MNIRDDDLVLFNFSNFMTTCEPAIFLLSLLEMKAIIYI